MKKIFLTITVLFVTLLTMAQSPNLMNFQGVARNAVGNVLPNQLIGVRLSILNTSATGPVVYQECRNVFTNAFGLFVVVMGSAGTICQTGTIAGVNWSGINPVGAGPKFLQVEIDPAGGGNYVSVGSTQMVSVPYALNAGGAAPIGPAGGDLTGTYPNPQILIPLIKSQSVTTGPMISMTNTAATGPNGAYFGSSASTDVNTAAIIGALTATAGGVGAAGVRGNNASTNANGSGVMGTHAGSGIGVYGTSPSGSGVRGESGGAGVGVYGTSASGAGVYGTSASNSAGFFENTTAANTSSILQAISNGSGNTVSGVNTGTGRGGFFQVNNAASTASAVEATTNGTGASWGGRFTSTGTNGAGLFVQSNATNTANNVQSNQAGLGTAGFFQTTNTANTADALLVTTNTTSTTPAAVHGAAGASGTAVVAKKGVWGDSDTGVGVYGTSSSLIGVGGTTTTGTGVSAFAFTTGTALSATSLTGVSANITSPAGNTNNMITAANAGNAAAMAIDNTNATGVANTIIATNANANSAVTNATTGGGNVIFARKGAALPNGVANPSAIYGSAADPSAGPNSIGVVGASNNGYGVAGVTYGNGFGVLGQASTAGSAGLVGFNSGTGYALVTLGRVQIQGQGAGVNKVLSSDAVGNATWNTLAAIGGVSGTGTLNYVAKWTPNGTTIGNSQIYDDGTNVGVGTGSPNGKLDVANGSNTIRGMQVINSSTTNPSSTIFAQNNSIGGTDPIESAAMTGLFSPILVATPVITGPSAIKGIASPTATVGALGGIGVQGASGNGYGVAGVSNNGTGVYAYGIGGTSYALQTNGRVQIQGQGAGAGKLFSSDAVGNGTWNTAASLNLVSGNGTLNFMTKWSPDGNTISNSQMFDNGTNIGLATTTPNARLDIDNGAATTRGAQVINSVATNNSSAIFAQTNNITSTSFFEGSAVTGLMPLNVATTMLTGSTTVKGIASTNAAVSQFSGIGVQGASAAGFGVVGNSNTGIALAGIGWGTGYGLYTFGKLQFEGQGAATGRIMSSTDNNGNAVWNTPAALNIVSGNGTTNFVPKWTPNGTTLGNSMAFDNGVSYSIGSTTPTTDILYVSNAAANTFATINQVGTNVGGISFTRANAYKFDIAMNAANNFYIQNYTAATTALTILGANSNVGINQNNPAAKLDVNGTFKLTDGTQGAGKVLTSDAAGNASWQAGLVTSIYSSAWLPPSDPPSRDSSVDGTLTKVYIVNAPQLTAAAILNGSVTVYFRVGPVGPYILPYISNAGGRANAIQAILVPGKIIITRPTFNETAPNNINLPATLEFRYTIIQ